MQASVEQSLWFVHKYVGEAAGKGDRLDLVLVPMLQHVGNFCLLFWFLVNFNQVN